MGSDGCGKCRIEDHGKDSAKEAREVSRIICEDIYMVLALFGCIVARHIPHIGKCSLVLTLETNAIRRTWKLDESSEYPGQR